MTWLAHYFGPDGEGVCMSCKTMRAVLHVEKGAVEMELCQPCLEDLRPVLKNLHKKAQEAHAEVKRRKGTQHP